EYPFRRLWCFHPDTHHHDRVQFDFAYLKRSVANGSSRACSQTFGSGLLWDRLSKTPLLSQEGRRAQRGGVAPKDQCLQSAIEIHPRMAVLFKQRHPDVPLFQDSAANARMICDYACMDFVDCVVSGLPWSTFSEPLQVKVLDETMRVLKPGGSFVTFAYIHG